MEHEARLAGRKPPELIIVRYPREGSSGHYTSTKSKPDGEESPGTAKVFLGTDDVAARHVIIHELSHWLVGVKAKHGATFWRAMFEMCTRHMPPSTYPAILKAAAGYVQSSMDQAHLLGASPQTAKAYRSVGTSRRRSRRLGPFVRALAGQLECGHPYMVRRPVSAAVHHTAKRLQCHLCGAAPCSVHPDHSVLECIMEGHRCGHDVRV